MPPTPGRAGTRRHPRTNARSLVVLRRDLIIVASIACTLLMVHVFQYACVAKAGYERARLRAEIHTLAQENSNLRADVEILERPQRIDHLARQRGMIQRTDADFVALAPLPQKPANPDRPMIAGFLPEWLNKLVSHKR
ncbi:MAG TPA: hypothetical protein VGM51_16790 [Armatimonadota bacterium]|jgi:cell division protein FtsL